MQLFPGRHIKRRTTPVRGRNHPGTRPEQFLCYKSIGNAVWGTINFQMGSKPIEPPNQCNHCKTVCFQCKTNNLKNLCGRFCWQTNSMNVFKLYFRWPAVTDEALKEVRPDALVLHGVDKMSTKDVFAYFKLFGPESLEWIDDHSCRFFYFLLHIKVPSSVM